MPHKHIERLKTIDHLIRVKGTGSPKELSRRLGLSESRLYVSCSSCIPDIVKWNNIAGEFIKYKVPIILICFTKDHFEYVKYLFENGKIKPFPFPVYLDLKGRFFIMNSFIKETPAHQAILVNNDNVIIATGNPIESDNIKTAYLKKITKHGL